MLTKRKPPREYLSVRSTKAARNPTPQKLAGASKPILKKPSIIKQEVEGKLVASLSGNVYFIENYDKGDCVLFRRQNAEWPQPFELFRLKMLMGNMLETEKRVPEGFNPLSKTQLYKIPAENGQWIARVRQRGLPTHLLQWSVNLLQCYEIVPLKDRSANVSLSEISTIRIRSKSGWFSTAQFYLTKSHVAFNELLRYHSNVIKLPIPKKLLVLRFHLDG